MSAPSATADFHCLIRCDASQTIATGHVMRCLAIADAVQAAGGKATFVMAECPPALLERVRENHEAILLGERPGTAGDARALAAHASQSPGGNVRILLDGYHLLEDYRLALRAETQAPLTVIDDLYQCKNYTADLIVNQNPGVEADNYKTEAKLLLGLRYAILRDEFIRFKSTQPPRQIVGTATKLVVTMGGSDAGNATALVINGLARLLLDSPPATFNHSLSNIFDVTAIVGGANPRLKEISALCQDLDERSLQRVNWHCLSAVKNMPSLLYNADLLISAGGTTIWEAAYLGVPTTALIIADNQKPGMHAFAATGAVDYLGLSEDNDADSIAQKLLPLIDEKGATLRREMAAAAAVVDGHGAARVVAAIADLK